MFYIGVDLGQRQDYTALAIVEREHATQRIVSPPMLVRRVQRVALGTPYPRVVEMIRETVREPKLAGRCVVVVDGTGVGAPVVDMLREPGLACTMTAVMITGGARESRSGGQYVSVPRRDLIGGVQLALEKGELRIALRMKEAGALARELIAMRAGDDGGEHDDLVLALALACWKARRRKSVWGAGWLPGF